MPSRIRKGDLVQIMAGREKGKRGEIVRVFPGERVIVRKVNLAKHHTRPTQRNPHGGILEQEAPIHASNVMLIDPQDDRPTRIGFELVDGHLVRIGRRTRARIPYRDGSA